MTRSLLPLSIILLSLSLILLATPAVSAAPAPQGTATPQPTQPPTFDVSRLEQPPTAAPPGQLDRGASYYWGVCMACHGDYGQGLTDEWRNSFGEDRNCWESGCHGPDGTNRCWPPWRPQTSRGRVGR